jgi:hypothetical protein
VTAAIPPSSLTLQQLAALQNAPERGIPAPVPARPIAPTRPTGVAAATPPSLRGRLVDIVV